MKIVTLNNPLAKKDAPLFSNNKFLYSSDEKEEFEVFVTSTDKEIDVSIHKFYGFNNKSKNLLSNSISKIDQVIERLQKDHQDIEKLILENKNNKDYIILESGGEFTPKELVKNGVALISVLERDNNIYINQAINVNIIDIVKMSEFLKKHC